MQNTNPQVDEYIKKARAFAQPILKHVRQLMHNTFMAIGGRIDFQLCIR